MTAANRLQKLRRKLDEHRVEAILVSQPENRRYLSGFEGSAGLLLITKEKAILATDFRYIEQAGRQAPGYEIIRVKNNINETEIANEKIQERNRQHGLNPGRSKCTLGCTNSKISRTLLHWE